MKAEDVINQSYSEPWDEISAPTILAALRAACGGRRFTVIDHENGGALATLAGSDSYGWEIRKVPVGGASHE